MQNLVADGILSATQGPAGRRRRDGVREPGRRAGRARRQPDLRWRAARQITYGEAFAVQPFGNFLVSMDLTGAQVQAILEQEFFPRPPRAQLVLGVSNGVTFDWNQSAPQGSKVSNVKLNGVPLNLTATYRVATNNFLADGGDGFTVFRQGTNRVGGLDDLTALVNYLGAASPVAPPATNRINEIP